jgi:hypothetical protein
VSDLERFFTANTGGKIHKWMHYFEIYERHFACLSPIPIT